MDMQNLAREIGLFEVSNNLAKVISSADVIHRVGAAMPLPDEDIYTRTDSAVQWLHSLGKDKYMFLTPEIALIDRLALLSDENTEIIVFIPTDMEKKAKERFMNNIPLNIKVTVQEEPFFPSNVYPGNGVMVICGYMGADRPMVLGDTYRMLEHYNGFLGKKLFIPYVELDSAIRYDGWVEANQKSISMKWRNGQ